MCWYVGLAVLVVAVEPVASGAAGAGRLRQRGRLQGAPGDGQQTGQQQAPQPLHEPLSPLRRRLPHQGATQIDLPYVVQRLDVGRRIPTDHHEVGIVPAQDVTLPPLRAPSPRPRPRSPRRGRRRTRARRHQSGTDKAAMPCGLAPPSRRRCRRSPELRRRPAAPDLAGHRASRRSGVRPRAASMAATCGVGGPASGLAQRRADRDARPRSAATVASGSPAPASSAPYSARSRPRRPRSPGPPTARGWACAVTGSPRRCASSTTIRSSASSN